MKQVVQSLRSGSLQVLDAPPPQLKESGVLVRTAASLISAGTERATLDFAKASLLEKARSRPDLVKQVLDKVRREGMMQAARTALTRLDRPVAPGYATAGTVLAVADNLGEFAVGDRVACAGAGYASHAEINFIPRNLVVPIPRRPDGAWVGFDEAAFTTLGAIALHGARLGKPELGDRAVVIGLGLIGLLAVQILRAHGCQVLGVDLDAARCTLARSLGAELAVTPADAEAATAAWSSSFGADLVLVTAASDSSEPARLAAELARDKGRIVAVGATGLDLPRRTLYHKELSVVVSRSYGPGRYDPNYEERGQDYPLAYVRWTERENMRAFLGLLADGRVDVRPLISHRFAIDDAERAYEALERESVLGIVLEYPETPVASGPIYLRDTTPTTAASGQGGRGLSFIGAGNFARAVLLPAAVRAGATLRCVVAATGLSARSAGDKFGFAFCSTDADDVWKDDQSQGVVIATRHDTHAALAMKALGAGKAVFVEKPLCVTEKSLDEIVSLVRELESRGERPLLTVGFNRRFAPATQALRAHFAHVHGPVNVLYRVNAGRVPHGSWVASHDEGGGRIVGEVCHFVDLCAYLANGLIEEVYAARSGAGEEDVVITLRISGGSVATVAYMIDGDRTASKERVEVFGGGAVGIIDDFRRGAIQSRGRTRRIGKRFAAQDKGHAATMASFVDAMARGAASPIPFESIVNTTRATFAVLRSLQSGQPVRV